jgi:acetyl-CoA acetyltransferase
LNVSIHAANPDPVYGENGMVVSTSRQASEAGIEILKKGGNAVDAAVAVVDPSVMGYGPVPSTEKLLKRFDLTLEDIGLIELNEAFAAQTIGVMRKLNINPDHYQCEWRCPCFRASLGLLRSSYLDYPYP